MTMEANNDYFYRLEWLDTYGVWQPLTFWSKKKGKALKEKERCMKEHVSAGLNWCDFRIARKKIAECER